MSSWKSLTASHTVKDVPICIHFTLLPFHPFTLHDSSSRSPRHTPSCLQYSLEARSMGEFSCPLLVLLSILTTSMYSSSDPLTLASTPTAFLGHQTMPLGCCTAVCATFTVVDICNKPPHHTLDNIQAKWNQLHYVEGTMQCQPLEHPLCGQGMPSQSCFWFFVFLGTHSFLNRTMDVLNVAAAITDAHIIFSSKFKTNKETGLSSMCLRKQGSIFPHHCACLIFHRSSKTWNTCSLIVMKPCLMPCWTGWAHPMIGNWREVHNAQDRGKDKMLKSL